MVQTVKVEITDDLDGTVGATTTQFMLDGSYYEIDLGQKNRHDLDAALAGFIAAARVPERSSGKAHHVDAGGFGSSKAG
jgi:outer membrane protein TolC